MSANERTRPRLSRALAFDLTPATTQFVKRIMLAVPAGVILLFCTSMWEIGWGGFTSHLMHPKTHASSFDFLAASLASGLAILMAATVATLAVAASVPRLTERRHEQLQQLLRSWMWFWIGTLLMYSLALMASSAYGFPRYSSAVLVQGALSLVVWFCLTMLNARGAAMLLSAPTRRRSRDAHAHRQAPAAESDPGPARPASAPVSRPQLGDASAGTVDSGGPSEA
jgi:small-conductance mechanosensitive channel